MISPARRAIFLDRDGHPQSRHRLCAPLGRLALAARRARGSGRFKAAGWFLVVVSNQSGIARGLFDEEELHALHARVNAQLEPLGAAIDVWRHCPHLPEITGPCVCRKPAPGLLLGGRAPMEY